MNFLGFSILLLVFWVFNTIKRWQFYLAGFVVLLLVGSTLFFHTEVDDAFITYRHVINVVNGHGLVFNPGDRVEGFSNFLWLLLLIFPAVLGFPLPLAAKILSVLSAVAVLALTAYILLRLVAEHWIRVLTTLALLITPSYLFWAASGLETMFYTFLLLIGTYLLLHEVSDNLLPVPSVLRRLPQFSAFVFGLLAITRPEGAMFAGLAFVVIFFMWLKERRISPTKWIVVFCMVVAPVLFFRYGYYGTIVPNPVIAKGSVYGRELHRGFTYIQSWALVHLDLAILALVGAVSAIFLAFNNRRWSKRLFVSLLLTGLILLQLVFAVLVRGDWMPFGRFIVPVLPHIAILAAIGFSLLYKALLIHLPLRIGSVTIVLLVVTTLVPLTSRAAHLVEDLRFTSWDFQVASGVYGKCLKDSGVNGVVVNFDDLGVFPYYSGLPIVDGHGLIQPDIARYNRNNYPGDTNEQRLGRAELILDRNPLYIIAVGYTPADAKPDFSVYDTVNSVPRYVLPDTVAYYPEGAFVTIPARLGHERPRGRFNVLFADKNMSVDGRWLDCIDVTNNFMNADYANDPIIDIPRLTPWQDINEILFMRQRALWLLMQDSG